MAKRKSEAENLGNSSSTSSKVKPQNHWYLGNTWMRKLPHAAMHLHSLPCCDITNVFPTGPSVPWEHVNPLTVQVWTKHLDPLSFSFIAYTYISTSDWHKATWLTYFLQIHFFSSNETENRTLKCKTNESRAVLASRGQTCLLSIFGCPERSHGGTAIKHYQLRIRTELDLHLNPGFIPVSPQEGSTRYYCDGRGLFWYNQHLP